MTIQDGTYTIQNLRSHTYFDNSAKNRDVIHGWDKREGSQNQQWEVNRGGEGYTLRNVASGRYASAHGDRDGTDVRARDEPCEWDIQEAGHGAYRITMRGTDSAVDLDKGKDENGAGINLWRYRDDANQQKWKFERVGGGGGGGYGGGRDRDEGASYGASAGQQGGYGQQGGSGGYGQQPMAPPNTGYRGPLNPGRYTIKNAQTSTYVDLAAGSSDEGAPIVGWSQGGGDNQKWEFQAGQSGYTIRNVASGTYLGHSGDAQEATLMCGHSQPVEWDVKQCDQGYQFHRVGANYVLDLARGSSENGAKVCLWSNNNAQNQKWYVEQA